jgi:cytochrome c peroxidase
MHKLVVKCLLPASLLLMVDVGFAQQSSANQYLPLASHDFKGIRSNTNLIHLGQNLFFSKDLSKNGSISCASCHEPKMDFSGSAPRGKGFSGYVTSRHPLPLTDLYLYQAFGADGRISDLSARIAVPLESPEMAVDWPITISRLSHNREFVTLAKSAGVVTFDRGYILSALTAFVKSLVSGKSRFDNFYFDGEREALSSAEQNGLRIFVNKAHCSSCHLLDGRSAPFTDGGFHAIGVGYQSGRSQDAGRSGVTGIARDEGAFRTPTLRNVGLRNHLMHDGSFASLESVIQYYNRGGTPGAPNLDPRITPLYLTSNEVKDLTAFLRSLTADIGSPPEKPP